LKKILFVLFLSLILNPTVSEAAVTKYCSKNKVNKIEKNLICKKVGSSYQWITITPKPITDKVIPTITKVASETKIALVPVETSTLKLQEPTKTVVGFKEKTYNSVINIYNSKLNTNFELKVISHSSVLDSSINNIVKRYEVATKFWQSEMTSNKILIIIGSNDDIKWVKDQLTLARPENKYDDWYNFFSKDMPSRKCTSYSAGSYGMNNQGYYIQSILLYSPSCSIQEPTDNNYATTVEHELTHAAQSSLTNNKIRFLPCWFKEGEASYFGSVLGNSSSFNNFIGSRNFQLSFSYTNNISSNLLKLDEKYNNFTCGTDGGYSYGFVAVEELVSSYSLDQINLFVKNIGITENWRQSFLNTFSISFEEWTKIAETNILSRAK
jgi:hypothetical protein